MVFLLIWADLACKNAAHIGGTQCILSVKQGAGLGNLLFFTPLQKKFHAPPLRHSAHKKGGALAPLLELLLSKIKTDVIPILCTSRITSVCVLGIQHH